jgi:hypothetical protein
MGNDGTRHGGLFRYPPGGLLETVARSDELPGDPPMFGDYTEMSVSLNADCQFVLWGSNGLENAIWVSDPNGAVLQVARTGTEIVGGYVLDLLALSSGANGHDGKPQSIDADGNVAFLATAKNDDITIAFGAHLVPDETP